MISHIKRKASHRGKESVKLRFHVVVYSVTGGPRSVASAIFTLERGEHAFESHSAAQARCRAYVPARPALRCCCSGPAHSRAPVARVRRLRLLRAFRAFRARAGG
jgi:hypothetical protein